MNAVEFTLEKVRRGQHLDIDEAQCLKGEIDRLNRIIKKEDLVDDEPMYREAEPQLRK